MSDDIPKLEAWPTPVGRRFGFAREPEANDAWSLSLWAVEDENEIVFVYGWAIPRPRSEAAWSSADVTRDGKARVRRVSLVGTHAGVASVITRLCRGEALGVAAEKSGLPLPADMPCAQLCLASNNQAVDALYAPTPWFVFPVRNELGFRSPALRPRASPNPDVPAIGAALLLRDKEQLSSRGPLVPDGRLSKVLEALEEETGLSFTHEDAARLGDLEIFLFPAAGANERARVHVTLSRQPVVSLYDLPTDGELIIRCTQEVAGLVLADDVRRVAAKAGSTDVAFESVPDGPCMTTVEVWAGDEGATAKGLWFRNTVTPIRRISLGMNLVTGEDHLDAGWLAPWARDRSKRDAVAAMRRVKRVHGDHAIEIGEKNSTFVEAAQNARSWAARTRPDPSGAKLFDKGARLDFAVWLRDELGRSQGVSRVLLVDPFFDAWGVEMFARVQSTNCTFEVVTALHRSLGEDPTRDSLLRACKSLDLVLQGVRLRITALRGDPRPIHDRVLLALDADGRPTRGFHLSNSLSGATSQHPLLVTVIGEDVLPGVADYVASLIPEDPTAMVIIRDLAASPAPPPPQPEPPASPIEDLADRVLAASEGDRASAWGLFATKLAHVPDGDAHLEAFRARVSPMFSAWLGRWLALEAAQTARPFGVLEVPITRETIAILTPYATPFDSVSRQAEQYFEFFHAPGGGAWAVHYGFSLLADLDAVMFASTVDAIAMATPSSAGQLAARAPFGALLAEATSCVVVDLSLRPSPSLLQALLRAKTDFLRALAAAAIGGAVLHERTASMGTSDALSMLEALPVQERLLAVSQWVGDLRVRANQRGRSEDEASRELRRALMAQLVAWWPPSSSPELLADVVKRAEGPIAGGWAADTTNDFLSALVREKKLTDPEIRRVWLDMLASRMTPDEGRSNFFAASDSPLTQVVAQLLARADAANEIAPFEAAMKSARRAVTKPFARTNYARWANARDRVLWGEAFARLAVQAAAPGSALRERAQALVQMAELAAPLLAEEKVGRRDPSGLAQFLGAVRKQTADPVNPEPRDTEPS